MSFIFCSLECKYQIEGYCELNNVTTINSVSETCPYRILPDNSNSLGKISNTDYFDI